MSNTRAFFDQLGDAARHIAAAKAQERTHYDNKAAAGFDPVTQVDRAIERSLRDLIEARFPDDAIVGEEFGIRVGGGESARRWSLDPIDGTRAFICGLPSWAVLVGLIQDERHVAGMIDLPTLNERLVAIDGRTLRNGAPVTASGCAMLSRARLSTTDPYLFEGSELEGFARVRGQALLTRFGLDAMAYARVATGDLDLVIESGLKRYDLDALVAVVRGADGTIGDWRGGDDWDGGRIVAAASRALYDEVVALLA